MDPNRFWDIHDRAQRDPEPVATQWHDLSRLEPAQIVHRIRGPFWDLLDELEVTLIVTREYEHLVSALMADGSHPRVSYLASPHPNGLAWDAQRRVLHVASTRNPNMIYTFGVATGEVTQGACDPRFAGLLLPVRARYLPGSMYIHDIAFVGRKLYANAVAMNAVITLPERGGYEPVWWPESIDTPEGPRFDKNYLQLNSIAAGGSLRTSYFTASAEAPSALSPGHKSFPVDRRGVLLSGRTRRVVARGLTRPHSARLHGRRVYVDNSGYGELVLVDSRRGHVDVIARLPGWTRGLCFAGDLSFVCTSRVLERFAQYAPGLDACASVCGIHAVDLTSGRTLASLEWPVGNQIFSIEALPRHAVLGFPWSIDEPKANKLLHDVFFRARVADSASGDSEPTRRSGQ